MSVKTISLPNKINNNLETPITQEELQEAERLFKDVTNDSTSSKNLIFPVPYDAPEFNFYVRSYGGNPTNQWAYHNADGKLLFHLNEMKNKTC